MTDDGERPAMLRALYERAVTDLRAESTEDPFAARDELERRVEAMGPPLRMAWEAVAARLTQMEIHRAELLFTGPGAAGQEKHVLGLEGTVRGLRWALLDMAGMGSASVQRTGPVGLLMMERWDTAGWPGWPDVVPVLMAWGDGG